MKESAVVGHSFTSREDESHSREAVSTVPKNLKNQIFDACPARRDLSGLRDGIDTEDGLDWDQP